MGLAAGRMRHGPGADSLVAPVANRLGFGANTFHQLPLEQLPPVVADVHGLTEPLAR
jgi:hypothetical protein